MDLLQKIYDSLTQDDRLIAKARHERLVEGQRKILAKLCELEFGQGKAQLTLKEVLKMTEAQAAAMTELTTAVSANAAAIQEVGAKQAVHSGLVLTIVQELKDEIALVAAGGDVDPAKLEALAGQVESGTLTLQGTSASLTASSDALQAAIAEYEAANTPVISEPEPVEPEPETPVEVTEPVVEEPPVETEVPVSTPVDTPVETAPESSETPSADSEAAV